jgi:predicted HicB family RNase H-like nuclease
MNDITKLIMSELKVDAQVAVEVQAILNEPGRIDFSEDSIEMIKDEIHESYKEYMEI